jgi:hypothetical protein
MRAATILQIQLKIKSGVVIDVILDVILRRLAVEMTCALMMHPFTLIYTSLRLSKRTEVTRKKVPQSRLSQATAL